MANLSGSSNLKSAVVSSSAPTQAKRSINGLSLMLSQRLSSTPCILPAASKDADDIPSPPSSAAAAAALLPPAPSTWAHADEGGEAIKVGGHFAQFRSQDFEPDDSTPFSDEWKRLRARAAAGLPGVGAGLAGVQTRTGAGTAKRAARLLLPSSSIKIKEEQKGESAQPVIKREERDIIEEEGGGGGDCAGAPLALEMEEDAEEDRGV
ncbi:hypothetical protein F5883DRAFT_587072, partial [Diaporthe sp. PMI_573]